MRSVFRAVKIWKNKHLITYKATVFLRSVLRYLLIFLSFRH